MANLVRGLWPTLFAARLPACLASRRYLMLPFLILVASADLDLHNGHLERIPSPHRPSTPALSTSFHTLVSGPPSLTTPSCTTNNPIKATTPYRTALSTEYSWSPARRLRTTCPRPNTTPCLNNARTRLAATPSLRQQPSCKVTSPARQQPDRPRAIATALPTPGLTCDLVLAALHSPLHP